MAAPLEDLAICIFSSAVIFLPLFILIFGLGAFIYTIYAMFKNRGERGKAMESFAKMNGLTCVPGDLFTQSSISGIYKGRELSCRFYSE